MTNPPVQPDDPKDSPWPQLPGRIWNFLIEPSPAIHGRESLYRARLLLATLLILSIAGLLNLIASVLGVFTAAGASPTITAGYNLIGLASSILVVCAYALSRTVHYSLAAPVAVASVLGATFAVVILDPGNSQGLSYLIVAGVLGSLFLSARSTAAVFAVTFVGLLLLPAFVPRLQAAGTLNTQFLIVTVGALLVMGAGLREHYLAQIDDQTRELLENEARLRELSIRDALTGLFNRRYLEEVLGHEMLRAARNDYPIGIIMADIDHFKKFNDSHGHAIGDDVLVRVSELLRALVRSSDFCCRYGGEEFIVVLPQASYKIALERARKICEGARRIRVQDQGKDIEAITLSLGVAVFPENGATHQILLAAVDRALYQAKQEGRDRVVAADQ